MPNTILNIDGVDLYPHLRVAPGEGFDPADTDLREPQFGDAAVGVGEPLLGVSEHNREVQIPVHIRSYGTALTNGVTNPGFEVDTTGWSIGTGGTATLTTGARQTAWSSKGESSLRLTGSVGAAGSTNFVNASCPATGTLAAAPADVWTAIVDFNVLTTPTADLRIFINWFTAASGFISAAASPLITQAGEQRILLRGTAPALTAFTSLTVQIGNVIGSADCYIDNVTLVKSNSQSTPFDGSDLNAKWTGTPHNSTSTTLVGKNGLHETIAFLSQTLQDATTLVWRDADADKSTFLNVQFARFEPEYNYRRSQRLWLSGVIRVFTKPYGSTGTFRSLGTVLSTGPISPLNVGSIAGDVPALINVNVEQRDGLEPSITPGRIYGVAAVPSGYAYNVPAASITLTNASAILKTIGAAAASYVAGTNVIYSDVAALFGAGLIKFGAVNFSPASMYEGRNRVLALIAPGGDKFVWAKDDNDRPLTPRPVIATGAGVNESDFTVWGFNAVDLGVWTVEKNVARATVGLTLHAEYPDFFNGNPLFHTGAFAFSRLLILPEERTLIATDYTRRLLGWDRAQMAPSTAVANINPIVIDQQGNPYVTPVPAIASYAMSNYQSSGFVQLGASNSSRIAAAKIAHPTMTDMKVEINGYLNTFALATPSSAMLAVGKYVGGNNTAYTARVHYTGASGAVFNLLRGGLGVTEGGITALSLLASKSVASMVDLTLSLVTQGPVIRGQVTTLWGSIVATLSASHAGANTGGQAYFALQASGSIGDIALIRGHVVSGVPSSVPEILMGVDGEKEWVVGMASTNKIVSDLRPVARGRIPEVNSYDTVVGFHLSAEFGNSNHTGSIGVTLQERFTYSR